MSNSKIQLLKWLELEVKEYREFHLDPKSLLEMIEEVKKTELPELEEGQYYRIRSAYYNVPKDFINKDWNLECAIRVEDESNNLIKIQHLFKLKG